MKKYILLLAAACQGLAMMAQSPAYKMKVILKDGTTLNALTEDVEEISFTKLGKVKVDISERYKTSTSLAVNLDIDANASELKAVCVPASQPVPNPKDYIERNATVDHKGPYKKSFDFLTPETDYVIYALAYDANGLPSEVSELRMTTGKPADDPFTVEATTTATKVDYSVTPKDPNIEKYITICTGLDYYNKWCDDGNNAGDVLEHFVALWQAMASMYGMAWQDEMWEYETHTGTTSNIQGHLMWNADQVLISFGVNKDGTLASAIQVDKFKTKAPAKSDIKINLTLKTNEWRNVVIGAEVSNDDTYLVNVQPASAVGDRTGAEITKWLLYEGNSDLSDYAKSGSQDWEFVPSKGGQKYYAIAFGMEDGAPTTEPVMIEFELPQGRFGVMGK